MSFPTLVISLLLFDLFIVHVVVCSESNLSRVIIVSVLIGTNSHLTIQIPIVVYALDTSRSIITLEQF